MPNERNIIIKNVRLNNQNSFLRALPENFIYLIVTHCIIKFILKVPNLANFKLPIEIRSSPTSKKHRKGQSDGGGQVFHTESL